MVPLQDLLGLGTESRMEVSKSIEGNWSWRLAKAALIEIHRELRDLTDMYGRPPKHEVDSIRLGSGQKNEPTFTISAVLVLWRYCLDGERVVSSGAST